MKWSVVRSLLVFAVVLTTFTSVSAKESPRLSQSLLDAGWIELFDGETLYGWRTTGDAEWRVEDGTIASSGDKLGWLMSNTQWGDFELHVEFKSPTSTNSGVFLRSALGPTDPTKDCYELNIAPQDNPFPTGSFVGRLKSPGIIAAGYPLLRFMPSKPLGSWNDKEWHSFDVCAVAGKFTVKLDGRLVLEYTDPSPVSRGHIGLQAKEGPIAFRNVRLRPLGLKSLFNGKDLTGWTLAGAELSKFDVTEPGEMHLTNGPGQIASEQSFGDFVMQLECQVNGDGLNSGVFFRTLPTGRWQGYESQINNRYNDSDRAKPADFGTGGIYRRQPARRVVADDHQWFTKTIVAHGPHFAVWVNGYQVSDWTDTRPEAENPREGLRLGPGVIAIQGHDPTTDFLFRKLRIGKLPE